MSMQEAIFSAVDKLMPELWEVACFIHRNPELSYKEYQSEKRLVSFLREKDFQCEEGVADLETAFVGNSGPRKGPAVGFVAEYDALPKLGHACGHNMIAASAVGAAVSLIQAAPELKGQVAVIGTPAEELPEPPAKQTMLDKGVFDGIDTALMMHGGDRTVTGYKSLAIDSFEFEFKGRPTHASKYPAPGTKRPRRRCADHERAGVLAGACPAGRPDPRHHCGRGLSAQHRPRNGEAELFRPLLDRSYLNEIEERVFNCARAGALATDTELTIKILGRNDNKILSPPLDSRLLENAIKAGAENVMEPEEEMGSTDFSNVSQHLPASTLKTAFVPKGTPGHTNEWTEAGAGPKARKAIEVASKAMALTAYQLLTDEGLMQKVKSQYRKRNSR